MMQGMLTELIDELRDRGLQGFAVISQGGGATPYLALAVGRDGKVCDPRNWETQATPEAALEDLYKRLS